MPAHHPVWLTFKDAKLEEKFRIWHSTQLSKVSRGYACIVWGVHVRHARKRLGSVQVSGHACNCQQMPMMNHGGCRNSSTRVVW